QGARGQRRRRGRRAQGRQELRGRHGPHGVPRHPRGRGRVGRGRRLPLPEQEAGPRLLRRRRHPRHRRVPDQRRRLGPLRHVRPGPRRLRRHQGRRRVEDPAGLPARPGRPGEDRRRARGRRGQGLRELTAVTAPVVKEAKPPAPVHPDGARSRRARRRGRVIALLFVLPALLLLGALVVYPVLFSVGRSLFDASGSQFVGVDNYTEMFRDPTTLTAVRNTAIWVVVAPTLLTGLGLILAVLVEKIRWATAFKLLLFMPMAVSFLAAGIIFRLAYDEDPDKGVLNAAVVGVHDAFKGTSSYPDARPRDDEGLTRQPDGSYATGADVSPGGTAALGLVGVAPKDLPGDAEPAREAAARTAGADEVRGVVYLDFTPGGGGEPGVVDDRESGLPGMKVEAVRDGKTVASTTTAADGSFRFTGLEGGGYTLKLPADNFAPPYEGISWLGPTLVTPA